MVQNASQFGLKEPLQSSTDARDQILAFRLGGGDNNQIISSFRFVTFAQYKFYNLLSAFRAVDRNVGRAAEREAICSLVSLTGSFFQVES